VESGAPAHAPPHRQQHANTWGGPIEGPISASGIGTLKVTSNAAWARSSTELARRGVRFRSFAVVQARRAVANDLGYEKAPTKSRGSQYAGGNMRYASTTDRCVSTTSCLAQV
jgi:hypothetical protein